MMITIRQPDDWHVHLRDGDFLPLTVAQSSRVFRRAIVMPNLSPPITTSALAADYRDRIRQVTPKGSEFEPLMTLYLTDETNVTDLLNGFRTGVLTAAKLYPAHATTNSQFGVSQIEMVFPVFEAMEKAAIPLLVHGESTRADVDVFDRERVFIDDSLSQIIKRFPALKIVFEHITTKEAVEFVRSLKDQMAATITPHHLVLNRNAMFEGGIRPHSYCLPVAKREMHRLALRQAATSGQPCFFLGTDSAPHTISAKESSCGCAGIFNSPTAIETYAQVFSEENALDRLENFASVFGARFYGLKVNERTISLEQRPWTPPETVASKAQGNRDSTFKVFAPSKGLEWAVVD